jgi:hypothetical protein
MGLAGALRSCGSAFSPISDVGYRQAIRVWVMTKQSGHFTYDTIQAVSSRTAKNRARAIPAELPRRFRVSNLEVRTRKSKEKKKAPSRQSPTSGGEGRRRIYPDCGTNSERSAAPILLSLTGKTLQLSPVLHLGFSSSQARVPVQFCEAVIVDDGSITWNLC